ncbi:hypothetical protein CPU09_13925 [Mammaliicoccus sciuri]|uniref:hypothetical protein n=1 Tax=Mammaliicoccus sciuri TaxID=1296 RepID=UPI000BBE4CC7|nr:hypothetical protein [Mammaliicoccus sciuri]PCM39977.1 hypothetical protein CPU09_13925 [Mammaliicoccus sciuri]
MSKENAYTNSNYSPIKLDAYQNFESVHEMDRAVKEYNKELNKPLYETLNLLKQFSCKVFGVSHLKIRTIAIKLKKSERTINRHIKYLKEHGFITVVNTLREKKGGTGANAYVINTSKQRKNFLKEKNVGAQLSHRKLQKNSGKTQSQRAFSFIITRKQTISSLNLLKTLLGTKSAKVAKSLKRIKNIKNYRACPEGVSEHVYLSYKPFFSDKQIEVLYNISLNKLVPFNFPREYDEQIIDKAFRTLLLKLKKDYNGIGEKVKNMFSYFAGIICRQANEYKEYIQHSQFSDHDTVSNNQLEEGGPVPAWLNRSNQESFTMYNQEQFEERKKNLQKEVEKFCEI